MNPKPQAISDKQHASRTNHPTTLLPNHPTAQPPHHRRAISYILTTLLFTALACDLSAVTSLIPGSTTAKPVTIIQSPPSNSEFREGEEIAIQSQSTDKNGIARIELVVDGVALRSDTPPLAGQESFTIVQKWMATAGTHTIIVRSYNPKGALSGTASVVVNVAPAQVLPAVPTQQALATQPLPTLTSPATITAPRTAATPTRTPTLRAQPSNTPNVPPGVYGLSIRSEPTEPKRGGFVTFFVTFLNTTGDAKSYRWRVRIYEPEKRNALGDTQPLDHSIGVGQTELASADNWRVTGPGPCLPLIARVFWVDIGSKEETEFLKPDKSGGPAHAFQVCP